MQPVTCPTCHRDFELEDDVELLPMHERTIYPFATPDRPRPRARSEICGSSRAHLDTLDDDHGARISP